MDSTDAIAADLQQLHDEVAQNEFRPAADEICGRLLLLKTRVLQLGKGYTQPDIEKKSSTGTMTAEHEAHYVRSAADEDKPHTRKVAAKKR